MDPRRRRGLAGISGGRNAIFPVEKPKNMKYTLKRLLGFFEGERKGLFITFLLILISSGLTLLVPFLIGKAIDAMVPGAQLVEFKDLKVYLLILLLVYLFSNGLVFFQEFIVVGIAQRVVHKIREKLFDKLQSLPILYFEVKTHGEIMSRLSNDVDNISTTISQSIIQLMTSVINILGSLVMMIYLSWLMTLASLITVPLVFLLTKTIANKTKALFLEQQRALGKLNAHIEESISGIQVVKAFNNEEKVLEEFKRQNHVLRDVGVKAQIWSGYLMPLMNVISNIGFAVISIFGGSLAVRGIISVGIIASFISYSRQFTMPLNELASTFNMLQSGIAGAERVFEILDELEERKDREDAIQADHIKGEVEFRNVSFEYKKGEEVLKDISFKVKPGTNVALVGPTGAGKTTIVNLLTGFYEINKGEILIDGINIKDYKKDSLRKMFGMVLQDTYLFSGTIKDNIRYGRLDARDEEIEKAAKMSRASEFVERLPKGYNSMLLEGGINLSQGQRQLLAIARAILANPSILILDEATSNVDTRTEFQIQEAMINLMKGRTTFIIAHRLSTIRDADIIIVIKDGKIVEKGNHNELINKKGAYYKLYMSQYEGNYKEN
ncbi:ABC transporter ATP-binding protein [Tepidimicrobium xylanilyticum]|uniref:ATP-binding cassette, subfamily B n=1 Tax=Tepidimicrobium xylanilyticum TaxID=1123352 RepID=A0A1H3DIR9_9FIRM|nr:ABC transporter ATP-binding protein [Tepidimicrobium xylanilyticum]GMG97355.1 putative ABC transporter ATP-binding protein [Tepidimicrobium xylanilyticum]SDX65554.1 ATP-binding cassette, subfamily B [Tepidimicrobium xylanilyticum]